MEQINGSKSVYKLSEKTNAFVTGKSGSNKFPCAGLERERGTHQPKRTFYLTLQNMIQLMEMLTHINALLVHTTEDSTQEKTLPLDDKRDVHVVTFNGKKYVGFSNKRNKAWRMNLSLEEFGNLAKQKDEVIKRVHEIKAIKKSEPTETHETKTPIRTIEMHKFIYISPESGEILLESHKWYLDHAKCQAEGSNSCPSIDVSTICKPPEMFIFSSSFELPVDNDVLARHALLYATKRNVETVRDKDCYACVENVCFSNPMHDDGCCMDWSEAVQKYYQQAFLHQPVIEEMTTFITREIGSNLAEAESELVNYDASRMLRTTWPLTQEVMFWRREIKRDEVTVFETIIDGRF